MKNLLLLLLFSFSIITNAQTVRHGVVVGASDSWLRVTEPPGMSGYTGAYAIPKENWKPRISFSAGYQLQFDIKEKYVLDAALLFQSRGVHVKYKPSTNVVVDETKRLNSVALNGVFNYKIWRGIRAGLGVEPTFYWNTDYWDNSKKSAFDFPLVIKAGYDFKVVEVSLSYKNGFSPVLKGVGHAFRAKTQDVQISVFVPLGTFGF